MRASLRRRRPPLDNARRRGVFDNCRNGHKAPFRKIALAVGLEGKMTATHAGPELAACLKILCSKIGPYPHASLDRSQLKKQTTRMLKVACPDCGYTVRTTATWIETGLPMPVWHRNGVRRMKRTNPSGQAQQLALHRASTARTGQRAKPSAAVRE